jgi:myo-inositol 2-dehydrogenase / D-chiro-inositol 1-dehydrogenase
MKKTDPTRREFVKTTAATGAIAAATPFIARHAHAAGASETLRIGLIGCGGRGTGAASQALKADKDVKLVALADVFMDKVELTLKSLSAQEDIAKKIDVPPEHRFAGFDAYKHLIDNVDVVLIATTPHFRPIHLKYAVEKGKHIFAEKPVAVDGAGVRSVIETCNQATAKGLSVVSGLCLRYYYAFQDTIKQIHDGAIGDVITLQANDYRSGIWDRSRADLAKVLGREPTEMEYQVRNWYHFTWLCGDFNVEQAVHNLDVCAWALNAYPTRCVCMGARQARPDNGGNIYDHFAAVYEFASGARVYGNCRQVRGQKVHRRISVEVLGAKGGGEISESNDRNHLMIDGKQWRYPGKDNPFYQTEHDELFASIRSGKPVNNGDYMAKSTLMAIMARESAYTGEAITWDQALNSKQDLSPTRYAWDAEPPKSVVAVPGETRFV